MSVFSSSILAVFSIVLGLTSPNIKKLNDSNSGSIDMGEVIQSADFEEVTSGYIMFYPKEMLTVDKTYPVLVWANGTMCPPALYTDLLKGVAQQGYIVIASSELMSKSGEGQIEAIDYIFDKSIDPESEFYGKVDPNKVGAFGHSQGGLGSINAANSDERIRAVVSIAGASTASQARYLSVPTMFLTGSYDTIVASSIWVKPSYDACGQTAVYASLKNGIHTSCATDADAYIKYVAGWFDAALKTKDFGMFKEGGELSQDARWKKGYRCKNMYVNAVASSFTSGNLWTIISGIEFFALVALVCILLSKKKKKA